jgi:hypothetical protein
MLSVSTGFALSVAAYAAGAFGSLACWQKPAMARRICCNFALAGAVLGGLTSVLAILRGTPVAWSVPSGIPLFAYPCADAIDFRGESRLSRSTSPASPYAVPRLPGLDNLPA